MPGRDDVKALVKRGVKRSLVLFSGRRRGGPARPCATILTYHSVGPRAHEMNVTPDAFRAQMEWIAGHCALLSLQEAAAGKPGVAVTFDDGYRDVLVNAAPVLHDLAIAATAFVVAGRAGGFLDHDSPHGADPEMNRLLCWEEIRSLHDFGILVGAHSLTHRRLSHLSEAEQRTEIIGSIRLIEEQLGRRVEAFAYPFGSAWDYDDVSLRIVRESGVDFALSNRYGCNAPGADRWNLRRIWIDRTDDLMLFQAKVDGRLDALRCLDSGPGLIARRWLNRMTRT